MFARSWLRTNYRHITNVRAFSIPNAPSATYGQVGYKRKGKIKTRVTSQCGLYIKYFPDLRIRNYSELFGNVHCQGEVQGSVMFKTLLNLIWGTKFRKRRAFCPKLRWVWAGECQHSINQQKKVRKVFTLLGSVNPGKHILSTTVCGFTLSGPSLPFLSILNTSGISLGCSSHCCEFGLKNVGRLIEALVFW